jgi:hypothetical protein
VVIKGASEDDAVLCTSDKTFALKHVETTNALLLLPPQQVWVMPLLMQKPAQLAADSPIICQLSTVAT